MNPKTTYSSRLHKHFVDFSGQIKYTDYTDKIETLTELFSVDEEKKKFGISLIKKEKGA